MRSKLIKRGFNTRPELRPERFNSIEISGDLAYCKSHGFVYDKSLEEYKLYQGQPCYYTDGRFKDGSNFYKSCYLFQRGRGNKEGISLGSCIKKVRKVKGIPKGTVVKFSVGWYYPGENSDLSYTYIENRNIPYIPDYEVSNESYLNNFTQDDYAKSLVEFLRSHGFIIGVWNENPNRIYGEEDGESCIGYGHGRKFGFASHSNPLFGYSDTIDKISFDFYDEFDKWSRCTYRIEKNKPFEEILEFLTQKNNYEG